MKHIGTERDPEEAGREAGKDIGDMCMHMYIHICHIYIYEYILYTYGYAHICTCECVCVNIYISTYKYTHIGTERVLEEAGTEARKDIGAILLRHHSVRRVCNRRAEADEERYNVVRVLLYVCVCATAVYVCVYATAVQRRTRSATMLSECSCMCVCVCMYVYVWGSCMYGIRV